VGCSRPFFPISFPVFPEKTDRDFQFPISENGKYPLWRVLHNTHQQPCRNIQKRGKNGKNGAQNGACFICS
jgi:hypothetical protein